MWGNSFRSFFPEVPLRAFATSSGPLGSRVDGDIDMVLIKSNFSEDPSMLFANLLEDLFATFLHVQKVKYVVAVFGLEA